MNLDEQSPTCTKCVFVCVCVEMKFCFVCLWEKRKFIDRTMIIYVAFLLIIILILFG